MPLEKIREPEEICNDPEHNPPMHLFLTPGTYRYTCPSCNKETIFEVPLITC